MGLGISERSWFFGYKQFIGLLGENCLLIPYTLYKDHATLIFMSCVQVRKRNRCMTHAKVKVLTRIFHLNLWKLVTFHSEVVYNRHYFPFFYMRWYLRDNLPLATIGSQSRGGESSPFFPLPRRFHKYGNGSSDHNLKRAWLDWNFQDIFYTFALLPFYCALLHNAHKKIKVSVFY